MSEARTYHMSNFHPSRCECDFCLRFAQSKQYPSTTIPEKHLPKDRIPLAILQEIALEISLVMTRAKSRDDVLILHAKAIRQAKQKALDYGVVHLIEWDTFLLNT